ncbi:hypothetical protein WDU94_014393 [Cyamophila willieti]
MNRILKPVSLINNLLHRTFSTLYRPIIGKANLVQEITKPPTQSQCESSSLLKPSLSSIILVNTWKYKVWVKKRCKGCYFVYRDGILHNQCHLKPKHKQIIVHPKPKNTWICSGVSTDSPRPW